MKTYRLVTDLNLGSYSVEVQNRCGFWQQVSPDYFYKGWLQRWIKKHGIEISHEITIKKRF